MHVAPTIDKNTSTTSVGSNDLVAPVICRATKFDWKKLAQCIPSLKKEAIQKHKRNLFSDQEILRPLPTVHPPATPVARRTRSNRLSRSLQNRPL